VGWPTGRHLGRCLGDIRQLHAYRARDRECLADLASRLPCFELADEAWPDVDSQGEFLLSKVEGLTTSPYQSSELLRCFDHWLPVREDRASQRRIQA